MIPLVIGVLLAGFGLFVSGWILLEWGLRGWPPVHLSYELPPYLGAVLLGAGLIAWGLT